MRKSVVLAWFPAVLAASISVSVAAELALDVDPIQLSPAAVFAEDDVELASDANVGEESTSKPAADEDQPQGQMSDSEIASRLSNPVGDIWSITNQYNINELRGDPFSGSRWQNNWNIQPVLPLHLTDDWN